MIKRILFSWYLSLWHTDPQLAKMMLNAFQRLCHASGHKFEGKGNTDCKRCGYSAYESMIA